MAGKKAVPKAVPKKAPEAGKADSSKKDGATASAPPAAQVAVGETPAELQKFKSMYTQYKTKALSDKKVFQELEQWIQSSDPQSEMLAKMCKARIYYHKYMNEKSNKQAAADALSLLEPLVAAADKQPQVKSLALRAMYAELLTAEAKTKSVAKQRESSNVDLAKLILSEKELSDIQESEWFDPAHEVWDKKDQEIFKWEKKLNDKPALSKKARLKQINKYLDDFHKKLTKAQRDEADKLMVQHSSQLPVSEHHKTTRDDKPSWQEELQKLQTKRRDDAAKLRDDTRAKQLEQVKKMHNFLKTQLVDVPEGSARLEALLAKTVSDVNNWENYLKNPGNPNAASKESDKKKKEELEAAVRALREGVQRFKDKHCWITWHSDDRFMNQVYATEPDPKAAQKSEEELLKEEKEHRKSFDTVAELEAFLVDMLKNEHMGLYRVFQNLLPGHWTPFQQVNMTQQQRSRLQEMLVEYFLDFPQDAPSLKEVFENNLSEYVFDQTCFETPAIKKGNSESPSPALLPGNGNVASALLQRTVMQQAGVKTSAAAIQTLNNACRRLPQKLQADIEMTLAEHLLDNFQLHTEMNRRVQDYVHAGQYATDFSEELGEMHGDIRLMNQEVLEQGMARQENMVQQQQDQERMLRLANMVKGYAALLVMRGVLPLAPGEVSKLPLYNLCNRLVTEEFGTSPELLVFFMSCKDFAHISRVVNGDYTVKQLMELNPAHSAAFEALTKERLPNDSSSSSAPQAPAAPPDASLNGRQQSAQQTNGPASSADAEPQAADHDSSTTVTDATTSAADAAVDAEARRSRTKIEVVSDSDDESPSTSQPTSTRGSAVGEANGGSVAADTPDVAADAATVPESAASSAPATTETDASTSAGSASTSATPVLDTLLQSDPNAAQQLKQVVEERQAVQWVQDVVDALAMLQEERLYSLSLDRMLKLYVCQYQVRQGFPLMPQEIKFSSESDVRKALDPLPKGRVREVREFVLAALGERTYVMRRWPLLKNKKWEELVRSNYCASEFLEPNKLRMSKEAYLYAMTTWHTKKAEEKLQLKFDEPMSNLSDDKKKKLLQPYLYPEECKLVPGSLAAEEAVLEFMATADVEDETDSIATNTNLADVAHALLKAGMFAWQRRRLAEQLQTAMEDFALGAAAGSRLMSSMEDFGGYSPYDAGSAHSRRFDLDLLEKWEKSNATLRFEYLMSQLVYCKACLVLYEEQVAQAEAQVKHYEEVVKTCEEREKSSKAKSRVVEEQQRFERLSNQQELHTWRGQLDSMKRVRQHFTGQVKRMAQELLEVHIERESVRKVENLLPSRPWLPGRGRSLDQRTLDELLHSNQKRSTENIRDCVERLMHLDMLVDTFRVEARRCFNDTVSCPASYSVPALILNHHTWGFFRHQLIELHHKFREAEMLEEEAAAKSKPSATEAAAGASKKKNKKKNKGPKPVSKVLTAQEREEEEEEEQEEEKPQEPAPVASPSPAPAASLPAFSTDAWKSTDFKIDVNALDDEEEYQEPHKAEDGWQSQSSRPAKREAPIPAHLKHQGEAERGRQRDREGSYDSGSGQYASRHDSGYDSGSGQQISKREKARQQRPDETAEEHKERTRLMREKSRERKERSRNKRGQGTSPVIPSAPSPPPAQPQQAVPLPSSFPSLSASAQQHAAPPVSAPPPPPPARKTGASYKDAAGVPGQAGAMHRAENAHAPASSYHEAPRPAPQVRSPLAPAPVMPAQPSPVHAMPAPPPPQVLPPYPGYPVEPAWQQPYQHQEHYPAYDPAAYTGYEEYHVQQQVPVQPAEPAGQEESDDETDWEHLLKTGTHSKKEMQAPPVPIALPAAQPPPAPAQAMKWSTHLQKIHQQKQEAAQLDEDAAYQAALAESARHPQPQRMDSGQNSIAAAGMMNRTGEYNCFLNVIVQCLWHIDDFRNQISPQNPERFAANRVVKGLISLFQALDHANSQEGMAGTAVDPTELREALDVLPGHGFRMGEMNDPSEVLVVVFDALKDAGLTDTTGRPVVETLFGLELAEEVRCTSCGVISHKVARHLEYYIMVPASSLRILRAMYSEASMGSLMRQADEQQTKKCDKDLGGCETAIHPTKELHRLPGVVTLLMVWEPQVSGEDIRDTVRAMDTELSLNDVYRAGECPQDTGGYALHSMFCYYGQHYFAFIYKREQRQWFMYDDTHVTPVGQWDAVVEKCYRGKIQPLVLFYAHFERPAQEQPPARVASTSAWGKSM